MNYDIGFNVFLIILAHFVTCKIQIEACKIGECNEISSIPLNFTSFKAISLQVFIYIVENVKYDGIIKKNETHFQIVYQINNDTEYRHYGPICQKLDKASMGNDFNENASIETYISYGFINPSMCTVSRKSYVKSNKIIYEQEANKTYFEDRGIFYDNNVYIDYGCNK